MSEICDPTNTQDLQVVEHVQISASAGSAFWKEQASFR